MSQRSQNGSTGATMTGKRDKSVPLRMDDETWRRFERAHRRTEAGAGTDLPKSVTVRKLLEKGLAADEGEREGEG